MSKTVKRVMTVMIIGLVAMLGAKTEAHTRWFNGKPRVCSICDDDATLVEVPANFLGIAELIVQTQKTVTILCPKETEVQVKTELTLVGVTPSDEWEPGKNNETVVPFVVSGRINGFCGFDAITKNPISSDDVEIREMKLTYNAYECSDPKNDGCRTKVLVSSMRLDCKLPRGADFDDPPPLFYDCKKHKEEHKLRNRDCRAAGHRPTRLHKKKRDRSCL